ncbi:MAG: hypothetical protein U1E15_13585 [Hyphomicrobiales bacterium]
MEFDPPVTPEAPAHRPSFAARLRTSFFTGVVIIAPAAITVWATLWFISLFDNFVKPLIPDAYNPDHYLPFKVPGTGLACLDRITLGWEHWAQPGGPHAAGLVGRPHSLHAGGALHLQKLEADFREPVLRQGHILPQRLPGWLAAARHLDHWLHFSRSGWRRDWTWRGPHHVCRLCLDHAQPHGGYVVFADRDQLRMLDMPVEDGLKLVISMGLVFPDAQKAASGITPKSKA